MKWSWKLGRAAGVDIYLHLTFLLFLGWEFFSKALRGDIAGAVWQGIVFYLLLFGTVVLHELGHAMAARRYGIKTQDIILLPIGGVARLLGNPGSAMEELVIALAGPAVNLVLGGLILVVLQLAPEFAGVGVLGGLLATWLRINLGLLLFNLIPAFPMDGGRVLRAILAMRVGFIRGTRVAVRVAHALAVLLFLLGLAGNSMLMLIAVFVWFAAAQEGALLAYAPASFINHGAASD
ncbi:MAG TPA: site-2 protease family protein [Terriglobia bacterium]|nr:site-2 protease family protein [Terriglobia bacterium]